MDSRVLFAKHIPTPARPPTSQYDVFLPEVGAKITSLPPPPTIPLCRWLRILDGKTFRRRPGGGHHSRLQLAHGQGRAWRDRWRQGVPRGPILGGRRGHRCHSATPSRHGRFRKRQPRCRRQRRGRRKHTAALASGTVRPHSGKYLHVDQQHGRHEIPFPKRSIFQGIVHALEVGLDRHDPFNRAPNSISFLCQGRDRAEGANGGIARCCRCCESSAISFLRGGDAQRYLGQRGDGLLESEAELYE